MAQKCTLCYDRLQGGLEPACAKACPTQSIQFGPVIELREKAQTAAGRAARAGRRRGAPLRRRRAVYGGLNAFFLLMDKPEVYRLPNAENARAPSRNNRGGYLATLVTAVLAVSAASSRCAAGGNRALCRADAPARRATGRRRGAS